MAESNPDHHSILDSTKLLPTNPPGPGSTSADNDLGSDTRETSLSLGQPISSTTSLSQPIETRNERTNRQTISNCLINIDKSLSKQQLRVFKLAISTLPRVSSLELESMTFPNVYRLLENSSSPEQAKSITVYILQRLNVPAQSFEFLIDQDQGFRVKEYELLDYVLSLWDVVSRMSDEVYSRFTECVQRQLLQDRGYSNVSKFEDRLYLIHVLKEDNFLTQQYLKDYSKFISESGAASLCKYLEDFCDHQGIIKSGSKIVA